MPCATVKHTKTARHGLRLSTHTPSPVNTRHTHTHHTHNTSTSHKHARTRAALHCTVPLLVPLSALDAKSGEDSTETGEKRGKGRNEGNHGKVKRDVIKQGKRYWN
jgi:hypothetical protein